ncbi:class I adenylate-forming enzyme family protein [Roseovarius amoyensis]|uniref:class I adenylate-forming enzyme family protein n=1 Tax=Roseovarius amoyensis TaxID=2211448 RepID=UPI0013A6ABAD|nr:class I adenylate-forming enzyme family protein [Roseovarius amoyensis]
MLTPNRSFMSAAPFFHCSGSMHAITVCLLAGCALHTVSTWDPDYFLDLIERHRGDTGHGIFFRDIVEHGESARRRIRTLKVAVDIGLEEFIRKLHDDFGVTGISNIYGMTETGGNFTMWYPDDPLDKRIRMNGRPQAGNEIRIVDPDSGTLVKVGETGEIQMRGRTVTPGYYNRPEANASTFVDGGWFRSGDLGSISAEGELQYIARLRDVIRVGGENVSPAEVERVVTEVTGLKEVSVVGIPDGRLGEIAALVYCSSDDHDWPSTLEAMAKRLAGFKMPRRVYKTDAMPMTATNKVQRVTLQKWIREDELARII